jgi:hypothetical protein
VAVEVRPVVLVQRPRNEVAAFMFDPANDMRWTGGITSNRPAQPGTLVKGAKVERSAKFLGRSFDYGYVVTEHEPDRLVEVGLRRHASRADLLRRLHRPDEATNAYEMAASLAPTAAERDFLTRQARHMAALFAAATLRE